MGILAKEVDGFRKTIQNNAAKVDPLQPALRASKHQVSDLQQQVGDLFSKMTQMEDHSRLSNLRLVGLKEGLLDYTDRQAILKGARAQEIKHAEHDLLFFPDYSKDTTTKRKAFVPIYKKMTALGLQPFLRYPAHLKVAFQGKSLTFDTPSDAQIFLCDTFQTSPVSKSMACRGYKDWMRWRQLLRSNI
ncbi:hypothetical protein DPEC_G00205360 [Dallia pectoralis]|uniref:Uncharacterized protein n=1 Tax=Dallia pectoralis TaxID=75939 RepID=A0ACC2G4A0_DALPE|nr:hypothetical protein DPEC_G00205360 [Dallia pectoralis]